MSDDVSLPPLPPDGAGIEELRAALRSLILWAQAREPLSDGSALDKFLTARNAVDLGQLTYVPGPGYVGGGGGGFVPGPGTSNPADPSLPTPISGLTVTPGVTFFFIEFDAPSYLQGGGNGRTIIYQANYSGSGPLPTFADAVEAATVPGRSTIVVIDAEPGVQAHFWAKAETRHPTLQASPTGGTNGVSATAGLIDGAEHIEALSIGTAQIANLAVTNAKIASMSAGKITAGEIAVGESIQSTGYTGSGSNEWRIDGDGVARFTGVIVSGTVYATAGEFGGITINGGLTLNTLGHLKAGQTAYNTGTGWWLGYDSTAYKLSIGSSAKSLTWDGSNLTTTSLVVRNASGAIWLNASGTNVPPWVVNGSSVGGGVELTTGATPDNTMELRSLAAGPGIAIGYTTEGAVEISAVAPQNLEVQLGADESTTTVGITPSNMSVPIEANKTHVVRGALIAKSASATNGFVVGCNTPTGAATVLQVVSQVAQDTAERRVLNLPSGGSGTVVFSAHFAALQASPSVYDANSFSLVEFTATVRAGATAGIFELVFGSANAGTQVTIKAGSSMSAQPMKAGVVTPTGLNATPAYPATVDATSTVGSSRAAVAIASISLNRDGSWATTKTGGSPSSGTWASSTGADIGTEWQVRFVPTSGSLSTNSSPSWTTLSSTMTATLRTYSPPASGVVETDSCTIQVQMKNLLSGVETTAGTVALTTYAESSGGILP